MLETTETTEIAVPQKSLFANPKIAALTLLAGAAVTVAVIVKMKKNFNGLDEIETSVES